MTSNRDQKGPGGSLYRSTSNKGKDQQINMNNILQFDPLHKIFEDVKDGTGLKKSIFFQKSQNMSADDPKSPMKVQISKLLSSTDKKKQLDIDVALTPHSLFPKPIEPVKASLTTNNVITICDIANEKSVIYKEEKDIEDGQSFHKSLQLNNRKIYEKKLNMTHTIKIYQNQLSSSSNASSKEDLDDIQEGQKCYFKKMKQHFMNEFNQKKISFMKTQIQQQTGEIKIYVHNTDLWYAFQIDKNSNETILQLIVKVLQAINKDLKNSKQTPQKSKKEKQEKQEKLGEKQAEEDESQQKINKKFSVEANPLLYEILQNLDHPERFELKKSDEDDERKPDQEFPPLYNKSMICDNYKEHYGELRPLILMKNSQYFEQNQSIISQQEIMSQIQDKIINKEQILLQVKVQLQTDRKAINEDSYKTIFSSKIRVKLNQRVKEIINLLKFKNNHNENNKKYIFKFELNNEMIEICENLKIQDLKNIKSLIIIQQNFEDENHYQSLFLQVNHDIQKCSMDQIDYENELEYVKRNFFNNICDIFDQSNIDQIISYEEFIFYKNKQKKLRCIGIDYVKIYNKFIEFNQLSLVNKLIHVFNPFKRRQTKNIFFLIHDIIDVQLHNINEITIKFREERGRSKKWTFFNVNRNSTDICIFYLKLTQLRKVKRKIVIC